jgi:hypothetical protein
MKSKRRMPNEDQSTSLKTDLTQAAFFRVQDEIWRVVDEAEKKGSNISLVSATRTIESAFPNAGLTTQDIADALVFAAVDAGVPLERQESAQKEAAAQSRLPRLSFAAFRAGRKGAPLPPSPSQRAPLQPGV